MSAWTAANRDGLHSYCVSHSLEIDLYLSSYKRYVLFIRTMIHFVHHALMTYIKCDQTTRFQRDRPAAVLCRPESLLPGQAGGSATWW